MWDDNQQTIADAVGHAIAVPGLREAVRGVYRDTEAALSQIRPACAMSGRCCRFEEYGHRLFVTTAELAVFVADARELASVRPLAAGCDNGGCRFQIGKLCGVHAIRPMGCRLFFCDPRHEEELRGLYETMHRRLKEMHEQLGIPYLYVEWRGALCQIAPLIVAR